jgi:murein DD-endopeptidase MepM/ murein hydrolase activator NlpD
VAVQQPVLLKLLGLLGTPPNVGVERPSLEHFGTVPDDARLALDVVAGAPTVAKTGAMHPPAGGNAALWIVALLGVLAAAVAARRRGRRLLRRLLPIAAGPLLIVAMLTMVAAGADAGVRPASPRPAPGSSAAARAVARAAGAVSGLVASPEQLQFDQLVTMERQVARDEAQIQTLTALADLADPATAPASPQRGLIESGLDPAATAHAVAASLESTLQQEYSFFLGVAQAPTQADALMQLAKAKPATVRDAVEYNVQSVQSQLAQEAAIAQAAAQSITAAKGAPGKLLAPLDGAITQPFGPSTLAVEPALTFQGVTYPHFHTGVDIAGPLDAPIRAAADGVVALAGTETDAQGRPVGYGNYVVLAHGGKMITLYGHLDTLLVHAGQVVHAGDVIGLEGSSGNSTGPHLHFEVRLAGLLADPLKYLGTQVKPQ